MKDTSNNTIVAINDTPDQLELLAAILREAGYHVLTAESAVEGLKVARRELPDLVISDVMMPDMDGIELCRLIRADENLSSTPIMLISALRKDAANVVKGLQVGADDYLESPYDPLNLAARAARLIERKRMEDVLRESENRFRNLIENLSDVISILTLDGTVLYESPSIENILGYGAEELIGKNAFDFIHPEDISATTRYFEQAVQKLEAAKPFQYRFRHKNDSWRYMESVAKLFDDPINGLVGVVNSRDVTERKEALEAMRESEESYRILAETASDAIIKIDIASRILFINAAGERMFGYRIDEMTGQSLTMLMPESMRAAHLAGIERYIETGRRNMSWDAIEVTALHRDGHEFPIELSFGEYHKGRDFFIGIARDITDRKRANAALRESEERFKAQYKNLPIPTTTWKKAGDDFVLVDNNEAAEEITKGLINDFLGIKASEMYDELPQVIEDFHRCFNEKSVVRRDIFFKFRTTGDVKHLDISYVFVPPDMIMEHYRDITAQVEAEELLRKSEERFQFASHATNDALWDWDLITNNVWYSDSYYKLLGCLPEGVDPNIDLWFRSIHPDDKDRVLDNIYAAIGSGENYWTDEYRLNSSDGSCTYIFDRGYIVYDEGKPVRMIGAAVNITERKLAEQILQTHQARLLKQNEVLNELTKRHKLFHIPFQTAVREITEVAAQILEIERVSVWLYNDDKSKIQAIDLYESGQNRHTEGTELKKLDYPKYFRALANNVGIAAHDARADSRTSEFSESYFIPLGITSTLDVPIRVGGQVVGVVCYEHTGIAREWKLDEQNFGGSMAGLISLLLEANERRQTEDALRFSQGQYASLINSIEGIVWESGAETLNFTFVSKQAERLLGYPIEKWLDEPNFWAEHIHPDDRNRTVKFCKTAVGKLENHEFDYRMIAADGSEVWLHDIVTVDARDKTDVRLRGVMVDITNSKQAENTLAEANDRAIREYDRLLQRLSTLGQKSGAARDLATVFSALLEFARASVPCSALFISLYDEERGERRGLYLWYNGKEVDVFDIEPVPVRNGYAGRAIKSGEVTIVNDFLKNDTANTSHVHLGFDEDERQPRSTLIAPMKMMGKIIGAIEVQSYDTDAFVEEHASAMRMAANIAANAIENLRLIELERSRAEQLRQSQKLESVGRLAGGIAHDFNNMLTAINGYSDLTLRRLDADSPLRKNIEEIKKAGERSAALTHQLLAFSRKLVLKPKVIDINHAITDVSMMLKRLIGEDVQLITNLASKLGHVEADPGQLTQVIMNLAVNARDAMPEGGEVIIETNNVYLDEKYAARHISAKAGSYVMVSVSDSGTGMDDETLQHIFEPFFTTKEMGKGTGLGLATVYGIVKQSGGYIWVYSEIDGGTTFKIYLPRIDEEVEEAEVSTESERVLNQTGTILLVEDEDIVRNLSRQILETCGYKVVEATNGVEALALFEQPDFKIDMVVTDVVMPKMSGRQLAERLEILRPGSKVLYMSGYTDDSIVRKGIIETGSHFIQKPFTFNAFAGKVKELLDAKAE